MRNPVVVAGVSILAAAILGAFFAAGVVIPAFAGVIGYLGSAPGLAPPETATVDGVISRLKLSPSGRDIHGFYLEDGTEVNLPPHAHGAYAGEVGQNVAVTGDMHTNLAGESLVNAAMITNTATGETLEIDSVPHAKEKHAKGKSGPHP